MSRKDNNHKGTESNLDDMGKSKESLVEKETSEVFQKHTQHDSEDANVEKQQSTELIKEDRVGKEDGEEVMPAATISQDASPSDNGADVMNKGSTSKSKESLVEKEPSEVFQKDTQHDSEDANVEKQQSTELIKEDRVGKKDGEEVMPAATISQDASPSDNGADLMNKGRTSTSSQKNHTAPTTEPKENRSNNENDTELEMKVNDSNLLGDKEGSMAVVITQDESTSENATEAEKQDSTTSFQINKNIPGNRKDNRQKGGKVFVSNYKKLSKFDLMNRKMKWKQKMIQILNGRGKPNSGNKELDRFLQFLFTKHMDKIDELIGDLGSDISCLSNGNLQSFFEKRLLGFVKEIFPKVSELTDALIAYASDDCIHHIGLEILRGHHHHFTTEFAKKLHVAISTNQKVGVKIFDDLISSEPLLYNKDLFLSLFKAASVDLDQWSLVLSELCLIAIQHSFNEETDIESPFILQFFKLCLGCYKDNDGENSNYHTVFSADFGRGLRTALDCPGHFIGVEQYDNLIQTISKKELQELKDVLTDVNNIDCRVKTQDLLNHLTKKYPFEVNGDLIGFNQGANREAINSGDEQSVITDTIDDPDDSSYQEDVARSDSFRRTSSRVAKKSNARQSQDQVKQNKKTVANLFGGDIADFENDLSDSDGESLLSSSKKKPPSNLYAATKSSNSSRIHNSKSLNKSSEDNQVDSESSEDLLNDLVERRKLLNKRAAERRKKREREGMDAKQKLVIANHVKRARRRKELSRSNLQPKTALLSYKSQIIRLESTSEESTEVKTNSTVLATYTNRNHQPNPTILQLNSTLEAENLALYHQSGISYHMNAVNKTLLGKTTKQLKLSKIIVPLKSVGLMRKIEPVDHYKVLQFGPNFRRDDNTLKENCTAKDLRKAMYSIVLGHYQYNTENPSDNVSEDKLFRDIHELFFHDPKNKVYILFRRLRSDFFLNSVDNDLYGSCDNKPAEYFTFPCSILVIEPNMEIQSPVFTARCPDIRRMKPHELFDPIIQPEKEFKWKNVSFIKMLLTHNGIDNTTQDECNAMLLKEVMNKYHSQVEYIFAAGRLDPKYFKEREHSMMGNLTDEMNLYYNDDGTPRWLQNQGIMKSLQKRSFDVKSEVEIMREKYKSVEDQMKPYRVKQLKEYSNTRKWMKLLQDFGFTHASPFNSDVTNDEDDTLGLGYEGHLMLWKKDVHSFSIPLPESIERIRNLQKKRSNDPRIPMKEKPKLNGYSIVRTENDSINTMKYNRLNHNELNQTIEGNGFTLKDAFDAGVFEGFNYFWRWTALPYHVLNESDYIEAAKACVITNDHICLKKVGFTGREDIYSFATHANPKIYIPYKQADYEEKGLCVWLSMCNMANLLNPNLSKQMISKMEQYLFLFKWLTVKKQSIYYGKRQVETKTDLLHLLGEKTKKSKKNWFQLQKNEKMNMKKFFSQDISGIYLFSVFFFPNRFGITFKYCKNQKYATLNDFLDKDDGFFVAFIAHSSYEYASHAIGVDCSSKRIYDPESQWVMLLNKEALDVCMGAGKFQQFKAVYELVTASGH